MRCISYTLIILSIFFGLESFGQQSKPVYLLEPSDWKFERIDFPIDFVTEIKHKGFEELRFSPGMFDTLSSEYFTYIFAVEIQNKKELSKKEIEQFLYDYYKGLTRTITNEKIFTIDFSKIKAEVKKEKKLYLAEVHFYDPFNDAKEISIYMEIELYQLSDKKIVFLALVSNSKYEAEIWNTLKNHKKNIVIQ